MPTLWQSMARFFDALTALLKLATIIIEEKKKTNQI